MSSDAPMSASPVFEKPTSPSVPAAEEQKKATEEWKRRVGQVFLSARDAITLVDLTGSILAWNPSAELIYGSKETEVIVKALLELLYAQCARSLSQLED